MPNWTRQSFPLPTGASDAFPAPSAYSKHCRWVECPLDGKFYIFGGDYGSVWEGGANQSGISATLAYDPRTIQWELAYPYWGIAGEQYPMHPDEVAVCWDSIRNRFWFTNGYQGGATARDAANAVGIQTRNIVQTFDPIARRWAVPFGGIAFASGQHNRSVHDPETDKIYAPYYDGGMGTALNIFDPKTGLSIRRQIVGIGNVYPSSGQTVHLIGRKIYFWDVSNLYFCSIDNVDPQGRYPATQLAMLGPMYGDQDNCYIPELGSFLVWTETPPIAHLVDRVSGVVSVGPDSPPLSDGFGYRPQHNNRHQSGIIVVGWSASESVGGKMLSQYWHYSLTDISPPPPPPGTEMKNIVATITTSQQNFPAGTVAQSYRFEIAGPESRFVDVPYGGALSATFADVADGTYTVTAELLDGSGQRLGGLLSQQVTVATAPADIILSVPAGLTVQVITVP